LSTWTLCNNAVECSRVECLSSCPLGRFAITLYSVAEGCVWALEHLTDAAIANHTPSTQISVHRSGTEKLTFPTNVLGVDIAHFFCWISYGLDDRGIELLFLAAARNISSSQRLRGLPCLLSNGNRGHENEHWPPSKVELKNAWSLASTPPLVFVQCLRRSLRVSELHDGQQLAHFKYRYSEPEVVISWVPC
jgi:hypothetical protein